MAVTCALPEMVMELYAQIPKLSSPAVPPMAVTVPELVILEAEIPELDAAVPPMAVTWALSKMIMEPDV